MVTSSKCSGCEPLPQPGFSVAKRPLCFSSMDSWHRPISLSPTLMSWHPHTGSPLRASISGSATIVVTSSRAATKRLTQTDNKESSSTLASLNSLGTICQPRWTRFFRSPVGHRSPLLVTLRVQHRCLLHSPRTKTWSRIKSISLEPWHQLQRSRTSRTMHFEFWSLESLLHLEHSKLGAYKKSEASEITSADSSFWFAKS